ncbi:site-specific DNA-methyltransferase, partial [Xenorhabdus sp. Vera]|nr:site-specific DNA-methyltransferase [Xenorhabdus sp. Vera]
LVRERFNVLNHIIWAKPHGYWLKQNKESLQMFFPATERIIFAEHYRGFDYPKDDGRYRKSQALSGELFKPLIDYFRDARKESGVRPKEINQATGKQMSRHWFSESQWSLPNETDYQTLQVLFRGKLNRPHHELAAEHQFLSRQY